MPLAKWPNGGGTNEDNSISDMYCAYCYEHGKFTPAWTLNKKQTFVKAKMKEMGFPGFLA